jgi:hypothetical protein
MRTYSVRKTGDRVLRAMGFAAEQRAGRRRSHASAGLVAAMIVAVALAVPGSALAASGSPALVGSVSDPSTLSGTTSVAVSGNYAYTTAYYAGRLTAIDISNPAHPTIAGSSPFANSLLNGSTVNIVGGYAYVASKNANGPSGTNSNDNGTGNSLTILDIGTNPAQPAIVGSVTDAVDLFGAYGVAVSGNYAYVAAQGCVSGQPCPKSNVGNSFAVVDISSPSTPRIVAKIHNQSLPAPWTGSGALNHACSVAVAGNYAYVTAAYSNRLTVIDISNPLSPTIVASLQDSSQLAFDVDVAVGGGYAYVADQSSGLGRLAVVDVHNPTAPFIAGSVTNSTWLNGAYRVRLRGNFAYVSASYAGAVSAVDISNPTNPRFAGGYSSGAVLNRTTGLDVDSSGRFLIAASPFLATQTQPLYPPYPLQSGPTITGTMSVVDLDPSPIAVTITPSSEPANPTVQTSASFTFSVSDPVSTVQCQLDGAPFGPCSGPTSQAYSALGLGTHSFTVQATDAPGNTATSSYTWVVVQPSGPPVGPTTPVLDNFNRANGGVGSSWSNIKVAAGFAAMNISGNAAVDSSATQYAWNYWNPSRFGPDSEAYVTVSSYGASDTIRIGARVTGGTNAYSGYFVSVAPGGAWSIGRVDNGGSPVTLASGVTQAIASGDKVGIRIVGSVVTALDFRSATGWTQPLSYDTASDSVRYTAAGSLALEFRSGTMDDFGGGTVVGSGPVNTVAPSLSGSAVVGQVLTVSPGSWSGSPAPTLAYQWQRCDSGGLNCVAIGSATSSSYTVVAGDAGSTLVAVVTGSNSSGSVSVPTAPSAVVGSGIAPTSPVLDNFNRANGGVGSSWSNIKVATGFAPMNISGNAAVDSSTTQYAWNYWNPSRFGPDSEAYVTVSSYGASDVIRIGARVTGGTNAYSGYFVSVASGGAWSIIRIDNGGSPVTLASGVTQAIANGDEIGIRIVGSVVTALDFRSATGWTQLLSYDTASDSVRYTAAGSLALEFRSGTMDDFGGGTIP